MKDKFLKHIKKNNKIYRVAIALFVYLVLHINGLIVQYNPMSWFLLIIIIMFYLKIDLYNKNYFRSSIIYSIVFSLLMTVGANLYKVMYFDFTINTFISFLGFGIIFYTILINLFPKLCEGNALDKNPTKKYKKIFLISLVIILICWIPYFLSLYPSAITNDSVGELSIVFDKFSHMSNHNPIIHVITIAIPYYIGNAIFHEPNISVACYSITQMVIMASIFSYLVAFLAKKGIKNIYLVLCILFFAIVPMHGYYSVTMWKDIIFAGLMVLLTIQTIKVCDKYDRLRFRDLIPFIIISLLTILYRNNAIYMYYVFAIFMLIFLNKKIKVVLLSVFIVIFSYHIITGPIFNYLHIWKSSSSEYLAIPLQQVGRMAYKDVKFTKSEKKILNNLMDIEKMKKAYNPILVDDIKFNDNYSNDYIATHQKEFFEVWAKLVVKHPIIATEAYSIQTLGYWYPGVSYWSVHSGVAPNSLGIKHIPKGPNLIRQYISYLENRKTPFINMTWSTSLAYWVLAVFAFVCIRRKNKRYILAYVPVFGVWLTLMIAAPVYAEFRYIYSVYTCLPVLMLLPYFKNKDDKK